MSELSSETNPQILVNGKQEEQQQDDAVAAEEQMSPVSVDEGISEDSVATDKERQAKVQSVFRQVRKQIRSQAPKGGMVELVQKVRDREIAQVSGEPEDKDVSSEDDAVEADEQMPSVSPDEECPEDSVVAEKEKQAKVQSVFQQVRKQIRSQAPKSRMEELVQQVRDREIAQESGEPEDKDISSEDDAVAADEQMSSVSVDEGISEDSVATDKERQAKVQSVFQQVRKQIRSQAPNSRMGELVQKVKDREMEVAQASGEPEDKDAGSEDDAAAADEQMSSLSPDEGCPEDSVAAEKERQAKVQSVFQQVRKQIRSQAPKSSMVELVQKVKDREMEVAQVNGEPEDKDVSSEERKQGKMLIDGSKDEMDLKEKDLCAIFETKLEASKKALRDEFEVQISQVRKDMQAYTDQALKDLECKMQSWQPRSPPQPHPKEQKESKGADKKQQPAAAPQLLYRRGRVLTRTMTTIIPKTCAPVIIGPRAKSETLNTSKAEYSRLLARDPMPSLPGNTPSQSRRPLLPPAYPPGHQRKRPVRPKAKTGN